MSGPGMVQARSVPDLVPVWFWSKYGLVQVWTRSSAGPGQVQSELKFNSLELDTEVIRLVVICNFEDDKFSYTATATPHFSPLSSSPIYKNIKYETGDPVPDNVTIQPSLCYAITDIYLKFLSEG